ncbi:MULTISPECIES: acyltransferase family protein [Niastella]|uniref:Acyltransferase n=1 Tax=Niastella soli TaxID=2821487 RepID=A0ABS3Z5I2_9BACT|nr:acyltransferase [Niastella soli]MBO9204925.1 acyltransferase [Niastella soli]
MYQTENTRIKSLDGLRGLAILLVLFLHLFNHGFLYPFFTFGWIGVELFFVLSGFLITGILIDTKPKKGFIQSFLVRRALRTLPLYYLVLILFGIIAPFFGPTRWFAQYQFFFWTHTSNFLFLDKGFFNPLGHFWSLALEEQFYLIWPFIVLVGNKKQIIGVAISLIVLGIGLRFAYSDPMLFYGMPLAHLDGISMGAIIAIVIRLETKIVCKHINAVFLLLIIPFLVFMISGASEKKAPFTLTIISFFFGIMLLSALHAGVVEKILSTKVLLFFGKYSYGMYVFNSLFFYFSNWAGADRLSENQRLIVYLGDFILTIIASYISYHLFESKFLRLKQKHYSQPVLK